VAGILFAKRANVICAKPNHQMPTSKKDKRGAKLSSFIPNSSGFNTNKKQMSWSRTLPV
jgi:hypothetical protein